MQKKTWQTHLSTWSSMLHCWLTIYIRVRNILLPDNSTKAHAHILSWLPLPVPSFIHHLPNYFSPSHASCIITVASIKSVRVTPKSPKLISCTQFMQMFNYNFMSGPVYALIDWYRDPNVLNKKTIIGIKSFVGHVSESNPRARESLILSCSYSTTPFGY